PECIFEAYARLVASDLDRALDDRRFHEDTPNCPSFDGIAFSGMTRLRSGPHSTPSDPIFESDTCDHDPPECPTSQHSVFNSSARIAIFFLPPQNCNLSGGVTGLPRRGLA